MAGRVTGLVVVCAALWVAGCGTYDLDPDADVDGDGHPASVDCADGRTDIHPAAPETCDGLDNDCDGRIDDAQPDVRCPRDRDGDTVPDVDTTGATLDCDDLDPRVYPGAPESCDDRDNDCDGDIDPGFDADGDGSIDAEACADIGGDDCDDADPLVHPCMIELCDGRDNNCDGRSDELEDLDHDGFASCAADQPDCDDFDPDIGPPALEHCDGQDNDCDGLVDEPDDAGDAVCVTPLEVCDGQDNDGDGLIDEGFDLDADGATVCGDPNAPDPADRPDCDDTSAAVRPGLEERCDTRDNDCDGEVDEAAIDATAWYLDADGDRYGQSSSRVDACAPPKGYADRDGDCDDQNPRRNPAATEVCDGLDNDCDAIVDEELVYLFYYADGDGDGYGGSSKATLACTAPAGTTPKDGDCDDQDPKTNPGVLEACGDKRDNDCDGLTDEGC